MEIKLNLNFRLKYKTPCVGKLTPHINVNIQLLGWNMVVAVWCHGTSGTWKMHETKPWKVQEENLLEAGWRFNNHPEHSGKDTQHWTSQIPDLCLISIDAHCKTCSCNYNERFNRAHHTFKILFFLMFEKWRSSRGRNTFVIYSVLE